VIKSDKMAESKFLDPVVVEDFTIPDVWFQFLIGAFKKGSAFEVSSGSYAGQVRFQMDFALGHIKDPSRDMYHFVSEGSPIPPPTNKDYVEGYTKEDGTPVAGYIDYLMTGKKDNKEDYTYGERLNNFRIRLRGLDGELQSIGGEKVFETDINQVEEVIARYKKDAATGFKTNQCCMEVGTPSDIRLKDPPCCRLIDAKVVNDKLQFYTYFRSWDLWGGFPGNICAIELLKQYMASSIDVDNGEIITVSGGLHVYDHCAEVVMHRIGESLFWELLENNPRIDERIRNEVRGNIQRRKEVKKEKRQD